MEFKQKTRAEISDEYKWAINDLVASDEVWQDGMKAMEPRIKGLELYKGRLALEGVLLECLTEQNAISEEFSRLYVYANMKLHEDANNITYQGFADRASQMHVKLMAAESFIEPEILSLDESLLRAPQLSLFRHYLDNLLRQKAHVLSAEIEEILARVHELGQAPDNIFSMFDNADVKFGTVADEEGKQVELTHGRYGALLESSNREVRKKAWHVFYDSYWYLKNTLAAAYSASVKKDVFFAKTRKYPSAMEAALSGNNIPATVYTGLISAVHESLPQIHRYMKLRKKVLDLPELHAYDLYTPIVKQVNDRKEYNEAVKTVLASLHPLGDEYVSVARDGFSGGWVDVYENAGKMNGAYSWGSYGGHPYILMNYENKVDDMFTLAHEMGHAMHSYYSWGNQPFVYGDYSIFLAEVGSTVNEALLMEHLLAETTDKTMRAFLVNTWLEQYRTTVFRQTLFAEFELLAHSMVEEGEALTADALNSMYRGLNEKYYGAELVLDDKLDFEWARIPHFYRAFYVYQYATGYSAAMAFARQILDGGAAPYLEFLKAGSSDYSIDILRKAGVDMADIGVSGSPQPVVEALKKFEELLDEMESLL